MKTLSKVLCMLIVVVMCMSFFGASAYAFSIPLDGSAASFSGSTGSDGEFSIPIYGTSSEDASFEDEYIPVTYPAAPSETEEKETEKETSAEATVVVGEVKCGTVDAIQAEIDNGAETISFTGKFTFDKDLEVEDVEIYLSGDAEVSGASHIKAGSSVYITGTGYMDRLPTLATGATLEIAGGCFGVDPSAFLEEGLKASKKGGLYVVEVDNGEEEEIEEYKIPDSATFKLTIANSPYTKDKSTDPVSAKMEPAENDYLKFFVVSTKLELTALTNNELLAQSNYDLDGDSNIILKKAYLDSLEDGYYYLYAYGEESKLARSKTAFQVKSELPDGTPVVSSGINVSVHDTTYDTYGYWKSGNGSLKFYFTPYSEIKEITVTDKNDSVVYSLTGEQWKDYYTGYFTLGESQFLSSLSSGVHTLKVTTTKGDYGTCQFYIKHFPTLSVLNSSKHVINSAQNLKFVSTDPIGKVFVGTKQLDNVEYDMFKLSDGGKTLTLTAQFLNNRVAGNTYSLYIENTNGDESNIVTFQILTTAQASQSVGTGDASNIGLWVTVLILSGAAVAVAVPRLRKKENKD